MSRIITELQKFGLNKVESDVYITLLKNHKLNGSQIAKILNVPRASVYLALNTLYQEGFVTVMSGDSKEYKATSPEVLFENLKKEYLGSLNFLLDECKKFEIDTTEEEYWNFKGEENFINKTKELLLLAEKEIYLNTNMDLNKFYDELKIVTDKKVRVVLFSFEEHKIDLPIEIYQSKRFNSQSQLKNYPIRFMLVIDCKKALIANGTSGKDFIGTFSDNQLLVSVISEHIHNDIYLYRLEQKYGKILITDEIMINSLHEKQFREKTV
ncbi:MAG: hypothetical protein A2Z98_05475 [Spirochaetes bacterium GWB1_27_13]|nr:MAG: hypothetical protein A2Z98_05475 [Spirochaetes bacterium GWB1_27_13]